MRPKVVLVMSVVGAGETGVLVKFSRLAELEFDALLEGDPFQDRRIHFVVMRGQEKLRPRLPNWPARGGELGALGGVEYHTSPLADR